MKCQDLQFELPLYFDDVLSPAEVAKINEHLAECPLCRRRLADMQELRQAMRSLARPVIPARTLAAIRTAVAEKAHIRIPAPGFRLIESKRNWVDTWLIPYAVGSVASVMICFTLLWFLLVPPQTFEIVSERQRSSEAMSEIMLASTNPDVIDISPLQYANARLSVAGESPSINPQGALVALTRSLMRGEMNDDEVVVVADVFGNGLARIAEVVEPSHDKKAIVELQKALQSDPDFAPFVPASMDRRSGSVRVVLKLQSVNVEAESGPPAF